MAGEIVLCLLSAYMTAYQSLRRFAKKNGPPLTQAAVLVSDAGTAVGEAFVNLSVSEGAIVVAASHRQHKSDLMKLGVQRWYDLEKMDWYAGIEDGTDLLIDTKGYYGNIDLSRKSLNTSGIMICTAGTSLGSYVQRDEYIRQVMEVQSWWVSNKSMSSMDRISSYDLRESYDRDPLGFQQDLHTT
mmetsp:Transcript_23942/g.45222  ORF Transcript_23942/g.45222 Transcript_23942/m.45222 type:complete len:186 (-) Transcript_23942:54-611(-)